MLYHYTCTNHLPKILRDGFLKLTDSGLRQHDLTYKQVVWMTTQEEPNAETLGLYGSVLNKTEVKIHIPKQKHFKYWKVFSRENKIDKKWAAMFEAGYATNTWWVSPKVIKLEDIALIENRITGEIYYSK